MHDRACKQCAQQVHQLHVGLQNGSKYAAEPLLTQANAMGQNLYHFPVMLLHETRLLNLG